MNFAMRDVRRGLDVFSSDGVYLGTVVWVIAGPASSPSDRAAPSPSRGRAELTAPGGGPLGCEGSRGGAMGAPRPPDGAEFNGEALGPMPTVRLGNSAPIEQSAATAYATIPRADSTPRTTEQDSRQPLALVTLRMLTALNWSTLKPSLRRIPVSMVQAVSHERIVLAVSAADLGESRSDSAPVDTPD